MTAVAIDNGSTVSDGVCIGIAQRGMRALGSYIYAVAIMVPL